MNCKRMLWPLSLDESFTAAVAVAVVLDEELILELTCCLTASADVSKNESIFSKIDDVCGELGLEYSRLPPWSLILSEGLLVFISSRRLGESLSK